MLIKLSQKVLNYMFDNIILLLFSRDGNNWANNKCFAPSSVSK